MAHPFQKIFEKALRQSTQDVNLVLEEAESLRQKGYSPVEINDVLVHLRDALIPEKEVAILTQAVEEFDKYL